MKKLMSLVCLLALVAMSAQAQSSQQKLERVMRQLLSVRTEKAKVQKAMQDGMDSVLYSFDKHEYAGNAHTVTTYYNMGEGTFGMSDVNYTISDINGRTIERGYVEEGDTLSRSVYTYDPTAANVTVEEYANDGEGMVLAGISTFYGVKNIEAELLNELMAVADMGIMICDSLQMTMFDEDTIAMMGYFTFDAAGVPTSFIAAGMDYDGIPVDIIAKMTYENKLMTQALLSVSAMDGVLTFDLLSVTLAYNADGQLLSTEIIPMLNEMFDLSAYFDIERMKVERTYKEKKLFSETSYAWNQIDSLNGEYVLVGRDYYTYYADGNVDTVYYYGFETEPNVGIAEHAGIEVMISPNPVKDMLHISGQEEAAEVCLFNAEGRLVLRSRVEAGEGSVSLQGMAKGVYFVRLQNRQGVSVRQIVKQ